MVALGKELRPLSLALSDRSAVRNAWIGWAVVLLVMSGTIVAGSQRTVVPTYRNAARNWFAGRQLYDGRGREFLYLPQAAILFVPCAFFPPVACELLWRAATIGTFAVGLRRFSRLAGPRTGVELFPLMTLVAVPLVWDCARNGQSTLALTGLMLLAVVDVARHNHWRAALWLALGVAVKPLMIVLVLLLAALDRPLAWRVLLGLLVVAILPFATQHPAYVLSQYSACLENVTTAAHVGVVDLWSQPFSALRLLGIDVPESVQTAVRAAAAVGTLGLCSRARQRYDAGRFAIYLFSAAATYLMLFNPRTENNSYAMLSPAVALFAAESLLVKQRLAEGALLIGLAAGIVGSHAIGRLLAPDTEAIWLAPLMAICFGAYVVTLILSPPRPATLNRTPSSSPSLAIDNAHSSGLK